MQSVPGCPVDQPIANIEMCQSSGFDGREIGEGACRVCFVVVSVADSHYRGDAGWILR